MLPHAVPDAPDHPTAPTYVGPSYHPPGQNLAGTATFTTSNARKSVVRTLTHPVAARTVDRVAGMILPTDVSGVVYHDPGAPCITAVREAKPITDVRLDNIVVAVQARPDGLAGPTGQTSTHLRILHEVHGLGRSAPDVAHAGGGAPPRRRARACATTVADGMQHLKVATEAFTLDEMAAVVDDLRGHRRVAWDLVGRLDDAGVVVPRSPNRDAAGARAGKLRRGPLRRAGFSLYNFDMKQDFAAMPTPRCAGILDGVRGYRTVACARDCGAYCFKHYGSLTGVMSTTYAKEVCMLQAPSVRDAVGCNLLQCVANTDPTMRAAQYDPDKRTRGWTRREDRFPASFTIERARAEFVANHAALLGCNFTSTDHLVRQHFSPAVMTRSLVVYDANRPETVCVRWSNAVTGKMNGVSARRVRESGDAARTMVPAPDRAWRQAVEMGAFLTLPALPVDLVVVEDTVPPVTRFHPTTGKATAVTRVVRISHMPARRVMPPGGYDKTRVLQPTAFKVHSHRGMPPLQPGEGPRDFALVGFGAAAPFFDPALPRPHGAPRDVAKWHRASDLEPGRAPHGRAGAMPRHESPIDAIVVNERWAQRKQELTDELDAVGPDQPTRGCATDVARAATRRANLATAIAWTTRCTVGAAALDAALDRCRPRALHAAPPRGMAVGEVATVAAVDARVEHSREDGQRASLVLLLQRDGGADPAWYRCPPSLAVRLASWPAGVPVPLTRNPGTRWENGSKCACVRVPNDPPAPLTTGAAGKLARDGAAALAAGRAAARHRRKRKRDAADDAPAAPRTDSVVGPPAARTDDHADGPAGPPPAKRARGTPRSS